MSIKRVSPLLSMRVGFKIAHLQQNLSLLMNYVFPSRLHLAARWGSLVEWKRLWHYLSYQEANIKKK